MVRRSRRRVAENGLHAVGARRMCAKLRQCREWTVLRGAHTSGGARLRTDQVCATRQVERRRVRLVGSNEWRMHGRSRRDRGGVREHDDAGTGGTAEIGVRVATAQRALLVGQVTQVLQFVHRAHDFDAMQMQFDIELSQHGFVDLQQDVAIDTPTTMKTVIIMSY